MVATDAALLALGYAEYYTRDVWRWQSEREGVQPLVTKYLAEFA